MPASLAGGGHRCGGACRALPGGRTICSRPWRARRRQLRASSPDVPGTFCGSSSPHRSSRSRAASRRRATARSSRHAAQDGAAVGLAALGEPRRAAAGKRVTRVSRAAGSASRQNAAKSGVSWRVRGARGSRRRRLIACSGAGCDRELQHVAPPDARAPPSPGARRPARCRGPRRRPSSRRARPRGRGSRTARRRGSGRTRRRQPRTRGDPEQPVQPHHVVDPQRAGAAAAAGAGRRSGSAGGLADALRVQRREAPLLALGEERVGRRAARGAERERASLAPRVVAVACTPSGRSRYSPAPVASVERRELLVDEPLGVGVVAARGSSSRPEGPSRSPLGPDLPARAVRLAGRAEAGVVGQLGPAAKCAVERVAACGARRRASRRAPGSPAGGARGSRGSRRTRLGERATRRAVGRGAEQRRAPPAIGRARDARQVDVQLVPEPAAGRARRGSARARRNAASSGSVPTSSPPSSSTAPSSRSTSPRSATPSALGAQRVDRQEHAPLPGAAARARVGAPSTSTSAGSPPVSMRSRW